MSEPPVKKAKLSKFRNWSLTIYPDGLTEDPNQGNPIVFPDCRWAVASVERCPTTKRLHVQAAVIYKNQVYLSRLQSDFGFSGHYEPSKGTPKQNLEYCTKSDTHVAGPWTIGEMPSQGKRSDWDGVKEDFIAKKTFNEVVLKYPHLAPCSKGLQVLQEACMPIVPAFRDVTVFILMGPTDVGKTHRVMVQFPDCYKITGKYVDGKSFDGYTSQDVLFIDEFKSSEWPMTLMNGLLDKWKLTLQCRYQNKEARWTRVIIATNENYLQLYCGMQYRDTFLRRLNFVELVSNKTDVIDLTRNKII